MEIIQKISIPYLYPPPLGKYAPLRKICTHTLQWHFAKFKHHELPMVSTMDRRVTRMLFFVFLAARAALYLLLINSWLPVLSDWCSNARTSDQITSLLQPPPSSYNFQFPHSRHGHQGRHSHGGHGELNMDRTGRDRHLNLTFQVTFDWQLSQFLRCLSIYIYTFLLWVVTMTRIMKDSKSIPPCVWAQFLVVQAGPCNDY